MLWGKYYVVSENSLNVVADVVSMTMHGVCGFGG